MPTLWRTTLGLVAAGAGAWAAGALVESAARRERARRAMDAAEGRVSPWLSGIEGRLQRQQAAIQQLEEQASRTRESLETIIARLERLAVSRREPRRRLASIPRPISMRR